MPVAIKRAYDPALPADGYRVLVDRLWPRGCSREELRLDAWMRELAPSTALRRWFGHEPARWSEFEARYRQELRSEEATASLARLAARAAEGQVTLVFAARDRLHNEARVLADELAGRTQHHPGRSPDALHQ